MIVRSRSKKTAIRGSRLRESPESMLVDAPMLAVWRPCPAERQGLVHRALCDRFA